MGGGAAPGGGWEGRRGRRGRAGEPQPGLGRGDAGWAEKTLGHHMALAPWPPPHHVPWREGPGTTLAWGPDDLCPPMPETTLASSGRWPGRLGSLRGVSCRLTCPEASWEWARGAGGGGGDVWNKSELPRCREQTPSRGHAPRSCSCHGQMLVQRQAQTSQRAAVSPRFTAVGWTTPPRVQAVTVAVAVVTTVTSLC